MVILGTCSMCGGPVSVPQAWWGVVPPVPQCEHCGATAAPKNYGPVIPMQGGFVTSEDVAGIDADTFMLEDDKFKGE